jgi:HD-GYP domain-containing protein (c-di-GMP phosphodiesterase class II)
MKGETIQPVQQFRVICKDGSIKWADSKAVVVSWDNKPATLNFIDEVTERKKVEETLNRSFSQLRKALGATVQAIAVMVETRDPYTAGHQRRVADLARSLAGEMNLLRDQVDGIRMTDIEFTLIKTHPQSGYDILKDMDFPWPIARMVLEHHERINGSGYPHGLTGDQLLIESRVLTVADVVEAMASHRPYRAGLGIEEALQEIEKNRGVLYDRNAVDACLRLFREKNFKLQEV